MRSPNQKESGTNKKERLNEVGITKQSKAADDKGTIHLRRQQIFTISDPYPPPSAIFTTIRRQIWLIGKLLTVL